MESGQPCLVPDFGGIAWSFSLFSLMLAVGLLYIISIMFRYVPCIPDLSKIFIINGDFILSKAFSASNEMTMWFLFFYLFIWWMTYFCIEPSLHLWDEADLVMVDDGSDVFLDLICQYFIEYFCINVHE